MSVYNFKDVEAKWQHKWEETNQYKTDTRDTSKPLYVRDVPLSIRKNTYGSR